MRGLVALGAVSFLALLSFSSVSFGAEDVDAKVSWDRIDDVADGAGSPFPRFDNFSWRAFIALNWPALTDVANRGQPDKAKKLGDPGPRVWETWKARYEVFAPGAPKPAEWNSYAGVNPCGSVNNQGKALSAFSHFADFNQASAALNKLANPLVAQNREYTRYEVRFNKEQFDTITDDNNKWYIKKNLPNKDKPGTFKDGSIEIKAAWRILTDSDKEDVRKRFYVAKDALVFDPEATDKAGTVVCNKRDVALVGFHIVIKTKLRPQWIWSSFEHVDNVPRKGSGEPDAKDVPTPYSYHSGKPPNDLSPKDPPATITEKHHPANPDPMQVVRKQPVNDETMQKNREYWELPEIKGTVWANYMLVMTQWPSVPGIPAVNNAGGPFPLGESTTLANTTMETYQQKKGFSCMQCHHGISNVEGMDFVAFMVFDATDPLQQAIARATSATPVASVLLTSKGQGKKRGPARKTQLDDDPSIKALVKILQQADRQK